MANTGRKDETVRVVVVIELDDDLAGWMRV